MKIQESVSCQELNIDKDSNMKICNKSGQHSLYNGIMSMLSLPSRLEWLSLYYLPFDWTFIFSIIAFICGMIYGNALLLYGEDIINVFQKISTGLSTSR